MAKSKYTFKPLETGYEVSLRGKKIGQIFPMKEKTGRHCFYLGFDKRRQPRIACGVLPSQPRDASPQLGLPAVRPFECPQRTALFPDVNPRSHAASSFHSPT